MLKKVEVTVLTGFHRKKPTPVQIVGYMAETFSGLVIHRRVEDEKGATGNTYTITHVRSGLRVAGNFPTRKRAVIAADALAGIANWNWTAKGLKRRGKRLGPQVRAIADKHGGNR